MTSEWIFFHFVNLTLNLTSTHLLLLNEQSIAKQLNGLSTVEYIRSRLIIRKKKKFVEHTNVHVSAGLTVLLTKTGISENSPKTHLNREEFELCSLM